MAELPVGETDVGWPSPFCNLAKRASSMQASERSPETEKPLTRADVLRLAKEHDGPSPLDLSERRLEERIDLSNQDLRGIILRRVNLKGANLTNADMANANLEGSLLDEAIMVGIDLAQARLSNVRLRKANLNGGNLQKAQLRHALLGEAEAEDADFQGAHLEYANLQGASLGGSNFQSAFMDHIDLSGAHLEGADFRNAHCGEADFLGASLGGANLQGAQLPRANLQNAVLTRANLNEASLEEADLRTARLYDVRLYYANLHNINWGDFIIGEERQGEFQDALVTYRSLKAYHNQVGMGNVAGSFYYREKEAQRKLAGQRKHYREFLWLQFFRFFAGYGEKPFRILGWYLGLILLVACLSYLLSLLAVVPTALASLEVVRSEPLQQDSLPDIVAVPYYFMVSLTSLGYGNWVSFQGTTLTVFGPFFSGVGAVVTGLFVAFLARTLTR